MAQRINHIEANIKREITKLYKSSFGKGPEDTTVKITGNLLYMRFDGALSQIEETLSATTLGKEIVVKIRDELIHNHTKPYIPVLEDILNSKVEGISYILTKGNSTMHLFLVFNVDLESGLIS